MAPRARNWLLRAAFSKRKAAGADDKIFVRFFFAFAFFLPRSLRLTSLDKGVMAETLDYSVRDVSCQLHAGCVELGKQTGV
jgi:hypothetical protein